MSLLDYSEFSTPIENSVEPHTLPDNSEVIVRCIGFKTGTKEGDVTKDWFTIRYDVPSDPMCNEFQDFHWAPSSYNALEPKQRERSMYAMKCLAQAFSIDLTQPFSLEELVGKEALALLGIRKGDGQYPDQNVIRKFI